ncbi:hypothetical protein [Acinetobacter soli]
MLTPNKINKSVVENIFSIFLFLIYLCESSEIKDRKIIIVNKFDDDIDNIFKHLIE